MDITFLVVLVPLMLIALHEMCKVKRESIKVEAICTEVKSGANCGVSNFHGTFHYSIDGKEYKTYDGKGSALKPSKKKPTYVYVNKNDYEKIVAQAQINFYYAVIIIGTVASVGLIINSLFFEI